MSTNTSHPTPDMQAIKARMKATWESGDFGQVATYLTPIAEQFMSRIELHPGMRVLDAACGNGNLAIIAARRACVASGLDIASNLIAQARKRAQGESVEIDFMEGDVEAMPYGDASFDVVVSMYGVMFAPRPERVVAELQRVIKPGGLIALANWTPTGFIGKMFAVMGRHVSPPAGLPSPLLWGDEQTVRARFNGTVQELRFTRQIARMRYPFPPAEAVAFFRRYYGPTLRAFSGLPPTAQEALNRDLIELQSQHNVASQANETDTPAEYLEVHAWRAEELFHQVESSDAMLPVGV